MEPLAEESLRWLVSRFAHLLAEHGGAIGRPELILPNGDFFPDAFERDAESVMRLTQRMLTYAPVSEDVPFGLAFLEPGDEAKSGGGCGSGACGTGGGGHGDGVQGGTLLDHEEGYGITLAVNDTGNPILMTTALARGVGAIVLAEAGEAIEPDMTGPMSELTANVLGFGVLLTCGSYVYGKSCGGVRVRQATHLSLPEHAHLLALFCRVHDHAPGDARGQFDTTQKEAFAEALAWVDSNPDVVNALKSHPETLVDGHFKIAGKKGILGRLFGRKTTPSLEEELAPPSKPKKTRTEAEERRLAEARALVEDALRTR